MNLINRIKEMLKKHDCHEYLVSIDKKETTDICFKTSDGVWNREKYLVDVYVCSKCGKEKYLICI